MHVVWEKYGFNRLATAAGLFGIDVGILFKRYVG